MTKIKPRLQDVTILFVTHRMGENLYKAHDKVKNRTLFGPAPRRECEDWMRGHTS